MRAQGLLRSKSVCNNNEGNKAGRAALQGVCVQNVGIPYFPLTPSHCSLTPVFKTFVDPMFVEAVLNATES